MGEQCDDDRGAAGECGVVLRSVDGDAGRVIETRLQHLGHIEVDRIQKRRSREAYAQAGRFHLRIILCDGAIDVDCESYKTPDNRFKVFSSAIGH